MFDCFDTCVAHVYHVWHILTHWWVNVNTYYNNCVWHVWNAGDAFGVKHDWSWPGHNCCYFFQVYLKKHHVCYLSLRNVDTMAFCRNPPPTAINWHMSYVLIRLDMSDIRLDIVFMALLCPVHIFQCSTDILGPFNATKATPRHDMSKAM